MNILVSGAGGKTGQAITAVLQANGFQVRPWLRRVPHRAAPSTPFVGDMSSAADWGQALVGMDKVYHICPNMHPDEVAIGQLAIAAAQRADVRQFVYHSVLHPHLQAMPHHWHKLLVEEMVLESGLPFTILQPTAYMQNIRAQWEAIVDKGFFPVPYPIQTRLSLVDLADVAAAAARVLHGRDHLGAIYELVGTAPLSQVEVAQQLTAAVGREVTAVAVPLSEWEGKARTAGLAPHVINSLLSMFRHYARHGLVGNKHALASLLGRPPNDLGTWLGSWIQATEHRRA